MGPCRVSSSGKPTESAVSHHPLQSKLDSLDPHAEMTVWGQVILALEPLHSCVLQHTAIVGDRILGSMDLWSDPIHNTLIMFLCACLSWFLNA